MNDNRGTDASHATWNRRVCSETLKKQHKKIAIRISKDIDFHEYGRSLRRLTLMLSSTFTQLLKRSALEYKKRKTANEDVLGTLLKLVKEDQLTVDDVKHLLLDLFITGMSTTAITLEWALTETPCHPKKITQAQAEIDQVLGKGQARSIEESDISNVPYTKAIKHRDCHPPAPFLVPHKTESNVQLCGYHAPKNAQVWVNVWSIYRVPSVWANPKSFVPERFLESEIDLKDRNFELVPFGTGRRMCPGMSLTHRMVHLMLATLHSFNWKLDHGLDPEDVIWKRSLE
ncbi:LOW QUALITY PROTEIN: hypothetical protein Cgig2_003608 [Carnegiea gigantea]|uniref:Cytochrome P450 n=1 Tax=Carnegiea gigantea TaxID=171969 RepID=A0A9Q1JJD3_9CARY|nr:LOW QUALITY PROTEIN: hypothetical protein Cgig2_003608 [Carnegiea gigantea]